MCRHPGRPLGGGVGCSGHGCRGTGSGLGRAGCRASSQPRSSGRSVSPICGGERGGPRSEASQARDLAWAGRPACGGVQAILLSLPPAAGSGFQAILQEAFLPPHFQDGLIVFLSKPGDASNPANYRPITLLNTDYRCFARLLALRLGRALAPVIDPQQTAFLPGRSIGENLLLLQLLPHALCAEQRSALAVFCDVRKAYDTVDRAFLWKVMGRLGVGGPFLRAAQALLSHTWARSCVRGAMSRSVSFSAGVRQGCPLAPLLYLFVGQALGRFLATVGVGITLQGAWLACSQYGDDVTAFLPSKAALPAFLQAMQVFGNASGQRLHPGKSQAMLLGNRTLPPMIPQAPVRLVRTAEALGVTFHEGVGTPTVDWQAQVAAVLHRFDRLAALLLSALGRGLGSAAYGVSRLLFYAEFVGMPPAVELAKVTRAAVALVDSGLSPGRAAGRRFHGVAAPLLLGSPGAGGFGMLPVTEHIRARHAVWGFSPGLGLVCALAQPQPPVWAVAAHGALAPFSHACHPLPCWPGGPPQWNGPAFQRPCSGSVMGWLPCLLFKISVMRRCSRGHGVPQLHFGTILCYLQRTGLPWPQISKDLAGTGITTVAELGFAAAAVTSAIGRTEFLHALAVHLPGGGAAFTDHSRTCARLHACVERLPLSWVVEAMAGNMPPATAFAALALPRLGWRFPGGPVQIQALSVRAAPGRSPDALASSASTAMRDLFPTSSLRATALLPHRRDQADVLKHL